MAKISRTYSTKEDKWYDEMKSIAPYDERQFERVILSKLKILFPDYHGVNYKRTIRRDGISEGSRPDFALIRSDYQEWWIVEVETIGDRLTHVTKQIRDFTEGDYNSVEEANHIHKKANYLDKNRLLTLTSDTPKVMVLVDDINSDWITALQPFNPNICIFKIFRSAAHGFEILSISGDYPYIPEKESFCYLDEPFAGIMKLSNPDIFSPKVIIKENILLKFKNYVGERLPWLKNPNEIDKNSIWISFKGQVTEWSLIEDSGEAYLQPKSSSHGLRANDTYVLTKTTRGKFIIDIR